MTNQRHPLTGQPNHVLQGIQMPAECVLLILQVLYPWSNYILLDLWFLEKKTPKRKPNIMMLVKGEINDIVSLVTKDFVGPVMPLPEFTELILVRG